MGAARGHGGRWRWRRRGEILEHSCKEKNICVKGWNIGVDNSLKYLRILQTDF